MTEALDLFYPMTKLWFGLGLNPFATLFFSPVICVNHIKESTWISLCALYRFGLGFQDEEEHTEFDLVLFFIWYLSHIHMVFMQLNILSWQNNKRNRIVYIDLSALRFNKKE